MCCLVDSLIARLNSHEIVELLGCKTVRIFAYSSTREQSNKRSLRACEARALRARKTLTPRFTDFFTDFEKKTRLFCSLLSCALVIYCTLYCA